MAERLMLAADAVVFTLRNDMLKILLIKRGKEPFKEYHALPGGKVDYDESFEDACKRELAEETGVSDIFLKRLDVYGDPGRDPRGRVVSVAYVAFINSEQLHVKGGDDAEEARWHSMDSLPKLAFDHKKIIDDALRLLRFEIQTTNITFQLLPERFTLSELQRVHELVLGKELDKRNFRKRLKHFDILKETRETKMEGAHRPARLYEFKDKMYKPLYDKVNVFL